MTYALPLRSTPTGMGVFTGYWFPAQAIGSAVLLCVDRGLARMDRVIGEGRLGKSAVPASARDMGAVAPTSQGGCPYVG